MAFAAPKAGMYIYEATAKQTATVIFAHGLGDDTPGWYQAIGAWRRQMPHLAEQVRFVLPLAPRIPITINFGMSMPGWYDIVSLEDVNAQQDKAGIQTSQKTLESLISKEISAGIPSNRIVLAGFSQGGAISLYAGVNTSHKLAGVIGLSTYMPLAHDLKASKPANADVNKDTPVFMGHGNADPVVQFPYGQASAEFLKKDLGWKDVTFKEYNGMGHNTCSSEEKDVLSFLKKVLPPMTSEGAAEGKAGL